MDVSYWILLLLNACLKSEPSDALGQSKIPSFTGRHLLIGTIHAPPYIILEHVDKNISHVDGFVHQIVAWFAEKHEFTFQYVEPPDTAYGAFVNGSWNGMIGMMIASKLDMVAASLSVTYPRSLVVDFTFAFSEDPTSLLIPFPQLDSTISGIIKPFQYEVWIGIILSLLIAVIVLYHISQVESHIYRESFHGETKWFPHFWFLFRVVANPNEVISFTLATRIVIASWCLTAVVFVNSYTSSLVSHLMAPKFLPLISTVKSLADSRDISIAVLKHTAFETVLFEATSGSLAKIGAHLRAHPENQLQNLKGIEDIVFNQRKAFPHEETTLKVRMHDDYKATKQCRLAIAKEPFYPDQHGFALPKSSSMTPILNKDIVWLRQLGLLDHWMSSYLPRPNRCSAPLTHLRSSSSKKLTLNYLSSAFLLLGVGVFLSIFAFVAELIFRFWNTTIAIQPDEG